MTESVCVMLRKMPYTYRKFPTFVPMELLNKIFSAGKLSKGDIPERIYMFFIGTPFWIDKLLNDIIFYVCRQKRIGQAEKRIFSKNNNPHVKRAVFTLPYKGFNHTTTLKGHQKRLTTAIFTLAYPLKGSLYSLVDRLSSIISSFS